MSKLNKFEDVVLYGSLLLGFAVVLCRLFWLCSNTAYAARAEAQSTATLTFPARRGNFYDCNGHLLTGLGEQCPRQSPSAGYLGSDRGHSYGFLVFLRLDAEVYSARGLMIRALENGIADPIKALVKNAV